MNEPDYVVYQGLRLPPPTVLRHGGKTDQHHVRSAKQIVQQVSELAGLRPTSRVLDIGCGAGRFLIGMLATYGRVERYVGLDVRNHVVDWCSKHLTDEKSGDIEFHWLDFHNERYNRRGMPIEDTTLFPLEDGSIDNVVLFSVFSHMTPEDTQAYLREIRRVLAPSGTSYCTLFVEDRVPQWEENPLDYIRAWSGPLHCARFERSFFEGLVAAADLRIERFLHRHESRRQSTYVLAPGT
jgi:SAM-dependent methyltransferase